MCFLFHKWGSWSKPAARQMVYLDTRIGQKTPYVKTSQFRTCKKCGLVQERDI